MCLMLNTCVWHVHSLYEINTMCCQLSAAIDTAGHWLCLFEEITCWTHQATMCGGVHACTFMSHEGTFVFKGSNVQTVCICLIKIFTSHQLQSVMFTVKLYLTSLFFTNTHFCMSSAETELERNKHVCCIYIWSLHAILVIRLLSDHKKYSWLLRTPHTDVWDSAKCKYIVQASYCICIIWTQTALNRTFCGFTLPFSLKSTIFAYSVEMKISTPLQRHIYVFNQTANESVKI